MYYYFIRIPGFEEYNSTPLIVDIVKGDFFVTLLGFFNVRRIVLRRYEPTTKVWKLYDNGLITSNICRLTDNGIGGKRNLNLSVIYINIIISGTTGPI
jgi:hypothetical protein